MIREEEPARWPPSPPPCFALTPPVGEQFESLEILDHVFIEALALLDCEPFGPLDSQGPQLFVVACLQLPAKVGLVAALQPPLVKLIRVTAG